MGDTNVVHTAYLQHVCIEHVVQFTCRCRSILWVKTNYRMLKIKNKIEQNCR